MHRINKIIAIATCLLASSISTAQDYQILFDQYESPYAGSTYFISGYNFYKYFDDQYIPSSQGQTDFFFASARIGKLSFEYILSSYFTVFQHEVFGHGYRAREFDFSKISYTIKIDSGSTYFTLNEYNQLNTYQQNAFIAGGLEANSVLAQKIRAPWFTNKIIDNRDALFYLLNQLEQVRYIYLTPRQDLSGQDGNDINAYINGINKYYNNRSQIGVLSINKLRTAILWDLLDPTLYYSIAELATYIYNGQPNINMFMLDVNQYKYLPIAHTILAPYGLEFQVQNILKTPSNKFMQLNLRYGSNSFINTFGIDFNILSIWEYKNIIVGNNFSVWRQPKMVYANALVARSSIGFADFISLQYKISKQLSLLTDLGYKTTGYLPGYMLSNAIILRLGCKW